MKIRFGLQGESFKLTSGNTRWIFNPESIDELEKSRFVTVGRGDWAAVQAIICCDEDYALNVGQSAWISQDIRLPVLRLAARAEGTPLETELHILDMHMDDDRRLRADALLSSPVQELKRNETRAVWCELRIPAEAAPGLYTVRLALYQGNRLAAEEKVAEAEVSVEVLDYAMPTAAQQKFHLDLWQHSSNIARKHEVPLWSDAHFTVLEQYVRSLGELGQKAVTLVVSEIPWMGQCCFEEQRMKANLFEYSIIPVTKKADGTFVYDYSPMQRYIDLCARYGIDRELSLYGLANVWSHGIEGFETPAPDYPDGLRVRYLDEQDGAYKFMNSAADLDAYIVSLEQYFLTTGQMDRVRLAADEPGDVEAYRRSISHLKQIAPAFRCKAAINHAEFVPEFGEEVFDFAPYIEPLSREYDKLCEYKRTMQGKRFLWYVCCGPDYPNTFLHSNLIESWFIGVLTSYAGLDGFLRWNYTVWNDDPRADVRYGNWPAGDTNFVYPAANGAPLKTLRYMALKRGIQFYELLERLRDTGDEAALAEAYAFVVRERDIRQYYAAPHTLEDMCSLNPDDYAAMKRFLLQKLMKRA